MWSEDSEGDGERERERERFALNLAVEFIWVVLAVLIPNLPIIIFLATWAYVGYTKVKPKLQLLWCLGEVQCSCGLRQSLVGSTGCTCGKPLLAPRSHGVSDGCRHQRPGGARMIAQKKDGFIAKTVTCEPYRLYQLGYLYCWLFWLQMIIAPFLLADQPCFWWSYNLQDHIKVDVVIYVV